jgi:hypothetical protein
MNDYRFTIPYTVRVADVNYGGHVSNAAVLNFFQDARIAYLAHLGPFSELDIGGGCGIILPEAHVRYLAEMFLGDELRIGVTGDRSAQLRLCHGLPDRAAGGGDGRGDDPPGRLRLRGAQTASPAAGLPSGDEGIRGFRGFCLTPLSHQW